MHIALWDLARKESVDPRASIMPQSLPDKRIADLSNGTDISAFGFSFRVPWPKLVARHDVRSIVFANFDDGSSINIVDESQDPIGPGLLANATPQDAEAANVVFGRKTVASRYGFFKAMMDASPRDASFFQSRARNAKAMTLLAEKDAILMKATVIYLVASSRVQGYQIGDPGAGPSIVQLRLFDSKDREYWIILHGTTGSGTLTQESINAIVASFVPPQ